METILQIFIFSNLQKQVKRKKQKKRLGLEVLLSD
jgi:hypothetical protein